MGTHPDLLTNSTHSSTKLITARKWDAVSSSTCEDRRLVYASQEASWQAASPAPVLPQENACTFSLKLQNIENIELPGADMLLSCEALVLISEGAIH